ncbi:hypothetical protein [Micromonospora sp. CPCC 205556]|uniref:hypothetical protein n=1 Tax=Micromonospora sp. CPCC 205556 TaxID=3122398 RepID=UPI002FF04664
MTMSDSDVRAALHRATDQLTTPPDLLPAVRRGGRRRLVRRRALLAVALTAVVAVPVGGALRLADRGEPIEVASPLLDEPTRGDLAGDQGYLRQVREAWRRHLSRGEAVAMRGEPHVVWAGNTPAGPAAYVAQRTRTEPGVSEPGGDRNFAAAAFVEPTADGPKVLTVESVTTAGTDGNSQAVLLGPERDVLVVVDFGDPVVFSPRLRYKADGRIDRDFQPVPFRDGAAVLPVPPQRGKITVALSRTPVSALNMVHIANSSAILFPDSEGSGSPNPKQLTYTLPGAERAWGGDPAAAAEPTNQGENPLTPYVDVAGNHGAGDGPLLTVYGTTPDGRRLRMETIQYDDDPARVVATLAPAESPFTAVASGFADWNAPLPVRLRLPDRQGVLVAAEGATFSYRTGAGGWRAAGRDAALLPATATEVRIIGARGTTTVPLTN